MCALKVRVWDQCKSSPDSHALMYPGPKCWIGKPVYPNRALYSFRACKPGLLSSLCVIKHQNMVSRDLLECLAIPSFRQKQWPGSYYPPLLSPHYPCAVSTISTVDRNPVFSGFVVMCCVQGRVVLVCDMWVCVADVMRNVNLLLCFNLQRRLNLEDLIRLNNSHLPKIW